MASVGVNTNGSQFYVSFASLPHMNGRCTVIGRMTKGEEVLQSLEKVFTVRRVPVTGVVITDCGVRYPK